MRVIRNAIIAALLAVGLVSIGRAESSMQELSRVTSPDSVVDAVLAQRATGATVATPYEVYIVPKGAKPSGEPLLRSDKMHDISVRWKQPRFLEIHYTSGRIFFFRNFWNSGAVQNWTYIVELRLIPASEAPSL
jgi:hypothetical protein